VLPVRPTSKDDYLIEYPFGKRYKNEGNLNHTNTNYIVKAHDWLKETEVAVKSVAGCEDRRSAHAELSIMTQLNAKRSNDSRSAHVVQLLDVFWDSFETVHLVMPKLNPLPRVITTEQLQKWIPHLLKVGFLFFSLFSLFPLPSSLFPPFSFPFIHSLIHSLHLLFFSISFTFQGLCFIHSNHIAHMDIKPDNLMIDQDENLIIIDFSVSLQAGSHRKSRFPKGCFFLFFFVLLCFADSFQTSKTQTKYKIPALGTLGFIAPEVHRGVARSVVCDVWGAGATILNLVCIYFFFHLHFFFFFFVYVNLISTDSPSPKPLWIPSEN